MRPSTTDACTVAGAADDLDLHGAAQEGEVQLELVEGVGHAHAQIDRGRDGDVVGVDEDHPLAERDPGVGDLHRPPRFGSRAHRR